MRVYNEYEAEKFLKKTVGVAHSQVVSAVDEIFFQPPYYLKIISDKALHKTEIGGLIRVDSKQDAEKQFALLISRAKKAQLANYKIIVQEVVKGEQFIIGIKKDTIFNHVILFGLGGIYAELLQDTAIRKCPITKDDAEEMILETKAARLFSGFRSRKLNLSTMKKTLVKLSHLPIKNKNILELDINPFILNEKEGKIVDARIVFSNQ